MKKIVKLPLITTTEEKAVIYITVDIIGDLEGCEIKRIEKPVIMPDNFILPTADE